MSVYWDWRDHGIDVNFHILDKDGSAPERANLYELATSAGTLRTPDAFGLIGDVRRMPNALSILAMFARIYGIPFLERDRAVIAAVRAFRREYTEGLGRGGRIGSTAAKADDAWHKGQYGRAIKLYEQLGDAMNNRERMRYHYAKLVTSHR